jgi:hypothetical protein
LRLGDEVNPVNGLESHLRRFGRRLRLRDGWLLAQRTFWIAALAGVLIQIAGRVFPIEKLWFWTSLPFLVWLLLVIAYSLLKPRSLMQIARRVDLELSLKERLSTALALQGNSDPFSGQVLALQQADASAAAQAQPASRISLSTPDLVYLQKNDALSVAALIVPAEAFTLNWLVRPLVSGAVLVAIMLASSILPNPQTLVLKQRAELQQAAKEQARQIEKARQEIEASQEISPEMKEELLRQLAELSKNLERNPGDLEQALADLSKLEQDLERLQDPKLASRQAMLESLASQLSQATGERKSQDAAQASEQALDQLAEQLKKMDEAQRQELAQNLARAASQAGQSGDAQLSQALASLAQAVQSGDAQSVQNASQQAKTALADMQTQMADQAALQRAIAQANASKQALAQTGRQVAGSNGNPSQSNPGNNSSGGQTGQTGGMVGGGGTKANKLPPARGGKRSVAPPQGNAPNVPAVPLESQVYAPWQKAASGGSQVFIPGQETEQGQTTTTESKNPMPGVANPALIPYDQVFYNYLNAANQAIDQNYIPASLEDYVRLYFSSLAP